ncbi:uncharacterized protein LOC125667155 isoform X2 [Ostrea edulis]|uniref:uncharacterized protein LOC125667155 isoform X2 n=1 Tax=Ostrea edulis TaxID=37623 RepID=UPI0024AF0658|nr:uncharacterized protein LOC125667155 isoform X2 [Ostrea edulis]
MQTTYLFLFLVLPEGIISLSVLTQSELFVNVDSNASIVLNCTYVTQKGEDISYIQWKKRNGSKYIVLAEFYPDSSADLSKFGDYLKNRSHLVNPGNGSTSAILNINDIRCEDDGFYQCYVWYKPQNTGATGTTRETDVIFEVDAEIPTKFMLRPNNSLDENDMVNLSCNANVGNPNGSIAIWRMDKLFFTKQTNTETGTKQKHKCNRSLLCSK